MAAEFGLGFTERNLANMVRCAEACSDAMILYLPGGLFQPR